MDTSPGRTASNAAVVPLAELVENAQAGDDASMQALYLRFRPLTQRVQARYGARPELRDDLPGELYLLFVRLVRRFEPERGVAFPVYLSRTFPFGARSLVRRADTAARHEQPFSACLPGSLEDDDLASRRESLEDRATDVFHTTAPPTPEDLALGEAELGELLRLLPASARPPFLLRLRGCDFRRIAVLTGRRECACRQDLQRARRLLRTRLGNRRELTVSQNGPPAALYYMVASS
jgi:DNA-directed RNA polymerase specialized sigma24 family protein